MIDSTHIDSMHIVAQNRQDSPWCMSRRKRCFDLAVSIPAAIALLPVMAAVACLIKLTSQGPALFRQERIGLHRKPFRILKFRTMSHTQTGPRVTRGGDPRMTRVGAVLRRLKLDELPQLFNVICGHMSLVGPRPKLAEHERMYLTCRPGVTGAATIAFAQEEALLAAMPESLLEEYAISVLSPIKHRLDARYVANASFSSDLRLIAITAMKLNPRVGGRSDVLTHESASELPTYLAAHPNLRPLPVLPHLSDAGLWL